LAFVETKDLTDLVHFSPDGPATHELFESERLWSQVVCLERNQQLGPITDGHADGLFVVVAGEAVVQVDRNRRRLKQWGSALVRAASEVTVTNASAEPAVLLVVTAPPPVPRAVTG
jgi:mannose-6-phosphate isomerase-like protein (cupin superfamily)